MIECRRNYAIDDLQESLGPTVECGYADSAGTRNACVTACEDKADNFEAEHSEACLSCEVGNLTAGCYGHRSTDCRPICTNQYRLDDLRYAYLEQLACWPTSAPGYPEACPGIDTAPDISTNFGIQRGEWSGSGTATVTSLNPFLLELPEKTLRINFYDLPAPAVQVGDRVEVDAEAVCPFGCWTDRVVVRRQDGALLFASWRGDGDFIPRLSEMELEYRASACGSYRDICSGILSEELIVRDTSSQVTLQPAMTADFGDFVVANGYSVRRFELNCTDMDYGKPAGAIVRRRN